MAQGRRTATDILEEILAGAQMERLRTSSRYSNRVYADEPIITTGGRMWSHLPPRLEQMKEISRYEQGHDGQPGRWLSRAELFYRQGTFMADYEDDHPYQGSFKVSYPTYDDMTDQQLRGYFTWRAKVRRGQVEETSASFAYVYLYELLCGIGVEDPLEGFYKMEGFIEAYRAYAPELGRLGDACLVDHVVYHGLDRNLLAKSTVVAFDCALAALEDAGGRARALAPARRTKNAPPTIPLPADAALEDELFDALAALSTYRIKASRLYKTRPEAVRHVACAVYVRLSIYHERQRKKSVVDTWFGERMELPYTMFSSAVFFDPEPHPDVVYQLDDETTFRHADRHWTCERHQGARTRSGKLGQVLRDVDRKLRQAYDFAHPLKDTGKTPKYLDQIIDQEIESWRAWEEAHAPREVRIDLGQLADIRRAAAKTREALLTDEEREQDASGAQEAGTAHPDTAATRRAASGEDAMERTDASGTPPLFGPGFETMGGAQAIGTCGPAPGPAAEDARSPEARPAGAPEAPAVAAAAPAPGPLDAQEAAWLSCLLEGASSTEREEAARAAGLSEDMLADAVNEALFDLVGDTVIEFGESGPELIEEYADEVREVLGHE